MRSKIFRWALIAMVASFGIKVFAHARLKTSGTLVPRSTTDSGIKTGPCGPYAKGANPPVFQPGQTITVNWEETFDHPGRYEFYLSQANDANFGSPIKTITDTQDGMGGIPHQYSTTITLPNMNCTNCTLQLVQVMTETTPPSLYYSCADLAIQPQGTAPTPVPTPTPGPGPVPAPSPNCN